MPVGDIPGWNEVFADDFTTNVRIGEFSDCKPRSTIASSDCAGLPAAVSSQLFAYPDGWHDTNADGTYQPSKVLSIEDGELDYYLHSADNAHLVSAVEPKIPGGTGFGGLKYGAYAVRFKSESLANYKTAFLLWPDSNVWPRDGEIDYPEGDLNGTFTAAMHLMGATSGSQQAFFQTHTTFASWHTAVIEWTPLLTRFILDGKIVGTADKAIPDTPMHWVLQVEAHGHPSDSEAGHVDIDWITAYIPAIDWVTGSTG